MCGAHKIDLRGKRFGRLLALEEAGRTPAGVVLWKCKCDCGNIKVINGQNLRGNATKSCGCLHKERTSQANKGVKASIATRKKMSIAFTGRVASEETRLTLSLAHKGKYTGPDSWLWKGGPSLLAECIRFSYKVQEWRKAIFSRDNWTCQSCRMGSPRLNAHHVVSFALLFRDFLAKYSTLDPVNDKEELVVLSLTFEPFWDIDNGVTLCEECHRKTANFGSRAGSKREVQSRMTKSTTNR